LSTTNEVPTDPQRVRWQAADPEAQLWASWDDGSLLFYRTSGQTHLLNDAAHRLLTQILLSPRDMDEIAAALGADWPAEQFQQNVQQTVELLWRLEDLGLVRAL
jgi:PqqD family protein of HPr-rel-A system